uniref:AAA+ ATPase domain-containing protein n=1 Tax=viral metagenome TaxID=1070528 RepID=A0A6C0LU98_9ZZZZ
MSGKLKLDFSIPWIEKYRPKKIDELILEDIISKQIEFFLKNIENTHLIITGQPGVGKTSTVKCIARETLKDNLNSGYLEMNAAEDRGVRSISLTIPKFCKRLVNFKESKIILLDEADNMTSKCQHDINEMIKLYGKKTKFIFTCNDSTKIEEDIQSVCRIIRFKKLTNEQIKKYLIKICTTENVTYTNSGLSAICYIADGDMRKAINSLQLTVFSHEKVNKDNVLNVCKFPDPEEVRKIMVMCFDKDLIKSNNALEIMIDQGYHYPDIINGFGYVLSNYKEINEELKLQLISIVNQTKITISLGLRTKVQLVAMLCRFIKQIQYCIE